jgi:murein DD-endopeptidase MepM/ murein hydrolase activator NlpD
MLARSGATGYVLGHHLHFAVDKPFLSNSGTLIFDSLPVEFINGTQGQAVRVAKYSRIAPNYTNSPPTISACRLGA